MTKIGKRPIYSKVWQIFGELRNQGITNAPNEEARLKLKPDNIKSMNEWKSFVKEKNSAEFKVFYS